MASQPRTNGPLPASKIVVNVSEHILNFPEHAITLTNYLKAETGLSAINPDAIFRLGQIMAARYPSVLANMHKNLPDITEQPKSVDRRRKHPPEQDSEMRRIYDEGEVTMRQLAKRFGLSASRVSDILKKHTST
jgi:hypothetical protein